MKKEIIISVVILMIVFAANVITQKYTSMVMQEFASDLEGIREEAFAESKEGSQDKINKIIEKWEKVKKKFVIYLEHVELEKIERYFIEIKANIETEEYSTAIQIIDDCIFSVNTIKDKYEFSLKNIF